MPHTTKRRTKCVSIFVSRRFFAFTINIRLPRATRQAVKCRCSCSSRFRCPVPESDTLAGILVLLVALGVVICRSHLQLLEQGRFSKDVASEKRTEENAEKTQYQCVCILQSISFYEEFG